MCVLISCEVGGEGVPAPLVAPTHSLAKPSKSNKPGQLPAVLSSDHAARYAAQRLAAGLSASLITNEYSSELIDVTRSGHHGRLFPPLTRGWPKQYRQSLIEQIYQPYRQRIRDAISSRLRRYPYVIHLSVRTFESEFKGKMRRADMGLLYDPAEHDEVDLCLDWIDQMYDEAPMLRVRRNYPRRGTTDSLTKAMRGEFTGKPYLGIELQLNRAWAAREVRLRDEALDCIATALKTITSASYSEAA